MHYTIFTRFFSGLKFWNRNFVMIRLKRPTLEHALQGLVTQVFFCNSRTFSWFILDFEMVLKTENDLSLPSVQCPPCLSVFIHFPFCSFIKKLVDVAQIELLCVVLF